jgi:hypothetical protein
MSPKPVSREFAAPLVRDADYTLKWIFRCEMRPIAFVDHEAFHSTNLAKLPTSRLRDNFRKADPLIDGGAGLPTTWRFITRNRMSSCYCKTTWKHFCFTETRFIS